jgi:hypothetical protein
MNWDNIWCSVFTCSSRFSISEEHLILLSRPCLPVCCVFYHIVATVWTKVIVGAHWCNRDLGSRNYNNDLGSHSCNSDFGYHCRICYSLRRPADNARDVTCRTPLEFQCTPKSTPFQSCYTSCLFILWFQCLYSNSGHEDFASCTHFNFISSQLPQVG